MWELYNSSTIAIPTHKTLPTDAPLIAWSRQLNVELENGTGFFYDPEHPVPDWVMQDQRHAYYASVSYVDEHIGAILATLEASGMAEDTLVLMHADHGASLCPFLLSPPSVLPLPPSLSLSLSLRLSLSSFPSLALHALNPPSLSLSLANPHVAGYHLGEHGEWEKKSNFDLVVRVPLQIHVPWLSAGQGVKTGAIVELVDIFPTIATLAGLPAPLGLDGEDRSALLSDPMGDHGAKAAFHQYPACGCDYDETQPRACFNKTRAACNNTPKNKFNFMGYTMRSPTARYTAWFPWNQNALVAEWTLPYGACVCLWFATRVAA